MPNYAEVAHGGSNEGRNGRGSVMRWCYAAGVARNVERDLAGREHGADLQLKALEIGPNDQPEQMGAGG